MEAERSKKLNKKPTPRTFDAKISTIKEKSGIDLGVRGDTKLGNFLKI